MSLYDFRIRVSHVVGQICLHILSVLHFAFYLVTYVVVKFGNKNEIMSIPLVFNKQKCVLIDLILLIGRFLLHLICIRIYHSNYHCHPSSQP